MLGRDDWLGRLLREPLLHFLALGALLFGLYFLVSDAPAPGDERRIEVSAGAINQLAEQFTRQWQRAPTAGEMQGLVESHIREEVLYREAMALGLDRDDTIVRRRLAQKMEFLSEDLASLAPPDEAELEAFYKDNAARFAEPARISFTHVFFSSDRRGAAAEADAFVALQELTAAGLSRAPGRGDAFLLDFDFAGLSLTEIGGLFGRDFAEAIAGLEPGAWHGPVRSGYGLHLVRIVARDEPRQPSLAEVRERVLGELEAERRARMNDEIYRRFRERYEIVVAPVPAVEGAPAPRLGETR